MPEPYPRTYEDVAAGMIPSRILQMVMAETLDRADVVVADVKPVTAETAQEFAFDLVRLDRRFEDNDTFAIADAVTPLVGRAAAWRRIRTAARAERFVSREPITRYTTALSAELRAPWPVPGEPDGTVITLGRRAYTGKLAVAGSEMDFTQRPGVITVQARRYMDGKQPSLRDQATGFEVVLPGMHTDLRVDTAPIVNTGFTATDIHSWLPFIPLDIDRQPLEVAQLEITARLAWEAFRYLQPTLLPPA